MTESGTNKKVPPKPSVSPNHRRPTNGTRVRLQREAVTGKKKIVIIGSNSMCRQFAVSKWAIEPRFPILLEDQILSLRPRTAAGEQLQAQNCVRKTPFLPVDCPNSAP